MKSRKLLLLLLLYFSMDFATPQLPGAVWVDDEGEDWVEASHVRLSRADRRPAAVKPSGERVRINQSAITEAFLRTISLDSAPTEWYAEFRRAPLLSSDPPSSLDDH